MTTLFEDADNANPPSPSLELLGTPLKTELDTKTDVPSEEVSSGNQSNTSTNANLDGEPTFTPFAAASNAGEISDQVRVVHVQVPVTDSNNTQSGNGVNVQVTSHNQGTLYAVGSGGQLQQVFTPSETTSGITAVTVDGSSQDASRYTYYPAVQTGENGQGGSQHFYVMMSPQDVIPVSGNNAPRIIAPRAQNLTQIGDCTFAVETTEEPPTVQLRKVEPNPTRSTRDERRRATHNEVERRRRDKINTWIMKLAAVVPDCQMDQSKQGTSKGGVLSKSLDHIIKLRAQNDRMSETIKEQERILVENQVLRQQVEKLRQENALLQAQNLQMRQNVEVVMETDSKPITTEE